MTAPGDILVCDANGTPVAASGITLNVDPTSKGFAVGFEAVASGAFSHAVGYQAVASGTYATAFGKLVTASGAGAFAAGEVCTASGDNASAVGYSCAASGNFANAFGSYCTATALGATAIGLRAAATRAGQFQHSGGITTATGLNAIDLIADIPGGAATLADAAGAAFFVDGSTVLNVRVRLTAVDSTGTKCATEVRNLLVKSTADTATILDVTPEYAPTGHTLAAYGWSCTISAPGALELRFVCDVGTDVVRVLATVEWTGISTLGLPAAATFNSATLPLDGWWRAPFVAGSPQAGTASAGTSGANGSLSTAPAVGAGHAPVVLNGTANFLSTVTAAPADLITTSAFSLVFLVEIAATPAAAEANYYDDAALATDNAGNWALVETATGVRVGIWTTAAGTKQTPIVEVPAGIRMIAATFDGTTLTVSVDAAGAQSCTPGGHISALGTAPLFGKNYASAKHVAGNVFEIRASKTCLSPADLTNIHSEFVSRYGLPA